MTKKISPPPPAPARPSTHLALQQSASYGRACIDWYGADLFELTLTCGFGSLGALAEAALDCAANLETLWADVDDPRADLPLRNASVLREIAESILCARGRLS